MSSAAEIMNFGSLNLDQVFRVPHLVRPGETLAARDSHTYPGGKGLNQSIALARAGVRVVHAGKIGPDGALLEETLREAGSGYVSDLPRGSGQRPGGDPGR